MNASNTINNIKKLYSLQNRIVVISGGGGFLAKYISEAVSEFGGIPILIDINADSLDLNIKNLKKKNFKGFSYVCDMSKPLEIKKTINEIYHKYKKIDVLVNALNFKSSNPAFFENFEKYEIEEWTKSLDINLTGSFVLIQSIGKIMKKQKKGSIINIASDVGVISPDHRIYQADIKSKYKGVNFNTPLSYSVSKSGIISLSRYLATYWAENGIRVNSISPAGVFNNQPKGFIKKLSKLIPLGRMANPEEIKGPIVFLASDSSSYITGTNLMVDGGRTAW